MGISKNRKPSHRHDRHPIQFLHFLHSSGKLWLNPEYQRNAVWVKSQKQLLIDSLLRGFDVPKLYFREVDKGDYQFEVVDGQQRLRSILDFVDDAFPLGRDSDDLDGVVLSQKFWSELPVDLQAQFFSVGLDVVTFDVHYTDDAIEELFLRLQNGVPLNAPEKRRAVAGNMRHVVAELAKNPFFPSYCGFADKRFDYEDITAKVLHLMLAGQFADLRAGAIRRTYEAHSDLEISGAKPKKLKSALDFLASAFSQAGQNPKLKKHSAITLPFLAAEMLDEYDVSRYRQQFGEAFLDFELARVQNAEKPEDEQEAGWADYAYAARGDSVPFLKFRHDFIKNFILSVMPYLALKDQTRSFSEEQRMVLFRRDGGVCKICAATCDANGFHADHIVPHSKGGPTSLENAQLLCPDCNLKKGAQSPA